MKIYENGIYRDLTLEEIAQMQAEAERQEREYWQSVSYDDAVSARIRERYSLDQELAISRQRDTKPEEFEAFFTYCEECKTFVKAKKAEYATT